MTETEQNLYKFATMSSDDIDEFVRLDHQQEGKKKSDIEELAEEVLEGIRIMPEDQFDDPFARLFGTSSFKVFNMVFTRGTLDGRLSCSFAVDTGKQIAWFERIDQGRAHLWYSEAKRGHKIFGSLEEMGPTYKKDCCRWLKLALQITKNINSSLPNKDGEKCTK